MKVLVTGATGVIGVYVVRLLVEQGHQVLATSRSTGSAQLRELEHDFEHVAVDVRDSERMSELLAGRGIETVIHLAASLPAAAEADPLSAAATNALASATLFDAAARAGVGRFVHASSKSAYGPLPSGIVVSEVHCASPTSCYGASKLAGELLVRAQALRGGPEATSLRFATIYAPGKGDRHAGASVLSQLLDDAFAGRAVRIEHGGDQVDDMIWVGDAAAGVLAAACAPGQLSPLYNICTGVGVTLREFAAGVSAVLADASIEVGPGLDYMGPGFVYGVLDPALARAELGFLADGDPQSGARRFGAALSVLPG